MELIRSIFSKTVVGLDIGVSGIKAVEISLGKRVSLLAYNRIPLPFEAVGSDGVIKNEGAVTRALKQLFSAKNFSTSTCNIGLFGTSVVTKNIHFPPMSRQEVEDQIYWEAEQYLPFASSDCTVDFAILGNVVKKKETGAQTLMEVLLVAAKKDYVLNLIGVIEKAGLKTGVIDFQGFALGNAFEFNYAPQTEPQSVGETDVLIDFGAGTTKLSFFERQNTVFSTQILASGMGCSRLISERTGESLDQSEQIKIKDPNSALIRPIIEDYNVHLVTDIQRTIDSYFSQSQSRFLRSLYYCGGGARTLGLIQLLEEQYPEQVQKLVPLKRLSPLRTKSNTRMIDDVNDFGAVAVGLALRSGGDAL